MSEPSPPDTSRDELFMRLFLSHERRILSFVLSLVPIWDDAHDLLQDTAATLWQKFDDFEEGSDFLAWSFTVARFRVLNYRKEKRRSKLRFNDGCFDEIADEAAGLQETRDERLDALLTCISNLDERDRELVKLRYQPGATTQSVADALGRSANSVYKLLNRIHRQLLFCVRASLSSQNRP